MSGHRQLVRNRDFSVLWVGEMVSEFGSRISAFVYPLLALMLGDSVGVAAFVQAAYFGGIVVALLPAGAMVDRLHRRRVLRAVSAVGLMLYAVMAAGLALGLLTVGGLAVGACIAGLCRGVYEPAQLSAVRSVVTAGQLPTALAQNQARGHAAEVAGAPVGGLLLAVHQWLPFAVDALTYVVSFVTLGRIRTDLAAPARAPGESAAGLRRIGRDIALGGRFVLRHPVLRLLASWSALSNLVVNGLLFVVVLRMARDGRSPAAIGLVFTVAGVAGVAGAAIAPWVIERTRTGLLTVAVAWSVAVPLIPLVWWATPAVAASCVGAVVLLNPVGNAGIGAYRIALTPPALQGRVGATTAFFSWSVMPLAPLLGGLLLQHYGGPVATAALLGGCLATALLVTLSSHVRHVPRPAVWTAELVQL